MSVTPGVAFRGRVIDDEGRPIPGAFVTLKRNGMGRAVTVDETGQFVINGLNPKAIRFYVSAKGYNTTGSPFSSPATTTLTLT